MIREAIEILTNGDSLSIDEAAIVMREVMDGESTSAQLAAFLVALRINGETPEEITDNLPNDTEPDENLTHNGHFLVHVKETGDIANDRYRLDDLMRLFVEFDGSDPVILEIDTGEKVVRLNMPFKVRAGTKLTNRLNELLGNKTVHTRTVSN